MPEIPNANSAAALKPEATQQIQVADAGTTALWVVQMNDHLRAASEIGTRLLNEHAKLLAYINSLPKAEEAKAV